MGMIAYAMGENGIARYIWRKIFLQPHRLHIKEAHFIETVYRVLCSRKLCFAGTLVAEISEREEKRRVEVAASKKKFLDS